MTEKSTSINIDEIRSIFRDDCEEKKEIFDEKKFQKFLDFLEIDLCDWVKGNLRYFYQQRQR